LTFSNILLLVSYINELSIGETMESKTTTRKLSGSSRVDELLMQRDRLNKRIDLMRNRLEAEEKRKETRRKLLAGSYFMKLMDNDLERVGRELVAEGMLKPEEFKLFNIPLSDNPVRAAGG
jgi:hypothetical protein